MAGNGDLNVPKAWSVGTPTLTTGSHATPPAQGDVLGDGGNPDLFLGSFTLQLVTPTLGVAALPAVKGSGDVGDVFGAPDTSSTNFNNDGEGNVAGLVAFNTVAPTLATGAHAVPAGNGDVGDTGGPTTLQGEPNDSNAGFGTLTSFNSGSPTLGLGSVTASSAHGDVGEMYGSDSGPIGQLVWSSVAGTLVAQPVTTPTGQGDIPNPYSWQDAVYYLTSQPYPLLAVEHMAYRGGFSVPPQFITVEHFISSALWTAGTLTSNLQIYSNWPTEHLQSGGAFTAGTLVSALVTYGNWPIEHIQANQGAITGGTLVLALVTYSNWPTEHVQSAAAITGGTLT